MLQHVKQIILFQVAESFSVSWGYGKPLMLQRELSLAGALSGKVVTKLFGPWRSWSVKANVRDWKKQSSWCWTQVSMIVFLLTPPLQLTIPKVTIFHPPWLLVYGTIQASRDSISGETLKTHWGDDIFCFGVLRFVKYTLLTLVYIATSKNMNSVSRMVLRSNVFHIFQVSILSESTGDRRGIVYNTRVFGPSSSTTLVVTNFFGDHWGFIDPQFMAVFGRKMMIWPIVFGRKLIIWPTDFGKMMINWINLWIWNNSMYCTVFRAKWWMWMAIQLQHIEQQIWAEQEV